MNETTGCRLTWGGKRGRPATAAAHPGHDSKHDGKYDGKYDGKQDGKPDRDRRAGKGTIPEAHAMVTAAPAATPGESTSTLSSLDKQADPGQPGDKDEVHVSEEELGVTTPREQRQ